jgi:hypothetical protein
VQDDPHSLRQQLNNIASIYANAQFTIIAADGDDATYGLRGIRGISQPRISPCGLFTLSKGCKVVWNPGNTLATSVWDRRGWTFQKGLFSRRRLIFGDDMIR